jgi:Sulfate permease family
MTSATGEGVEAAAAAVAAAAAEEAPAVGSATRSVSLITGEVAAADAPEAVVSELFDDDPLLLRHRAPPTNIAAATASTTNHGSSSRRLIAATTAHEGPREKANRMYADSAVEVRHLVPLDTDTANAAAESNDPRRHKKKKKNHNNNIEGDDDDDYGDDDENASCWKWIKGKMLQQRVACRSAVQEQKSICTTAVAEYNKTKLFQDVLAGITVAIMAVPLGMSYARLAGLPAYYGLYGTFIPPLVYPLVGSCRHLAVGPAALVSLLIGAGIPAIVRDENPELAHVDETDPAYIEAYTQLAIQCSLLVGILNLAMGLLRCGFVTQFLSRALISGFTSGASIIIAVSQIKYLFGYTIPTSNQFHNIIKYLVENIDEFDWRTFVMGTISIILMVSLRQFSLKYPKYTWVQALGPFVVTVATIVTVYVMDLDVPVVGAIPPGLPSVTIAQWSPLSNRLWTIVLSIVIVAFVQSFSIAKRMAYKHSYEVYANQELLALGVANFMGAMFQSYPTTGAIGQSAINESVGAQTGLSSCVTAAAVMCVLLFLTPVFEYMPLAALGAIVISYVLGMFVSIST